MSTKIFGLKKPIFVLAPMANITTYPFASQCIKFGADLVWTPMVHTDTIINNWSEANKILNFKDIKNYIVQIIGSDPDKVFQAISIINKKLKPKGIDLNFACPDKNIIKSGCGGYLMQHPDKIIEIYLKAKSATKLPVSIKIRAGWDNMKDIFDITEKLLNCGIKTITLHPRTVKSAFNGEADWRIIKKLAKKFPELNIIGSGNILTWDQAIKTQKDTGCAGIMIGRGTLGRPWIFKEIKNKKNHTFNIKEVKKLALDLSKKAEKIWGEKGIIESRKHFAWYLKGFDGAQVLRKNVMTAKNYQDIKSLL